jgi:hypothetical protein
MASAAELKRAKELLKINKELSDLRKGDVNVSFSATESLKELYGIRSKNSEAERVSLKNARSVNDALLNQSKTYQSINQLQREVVKNQNIINKSTESQKSISKALGEERVDNIKDLVNEQSRFLNQEKKIRLIESLGLKLKDKELESNKLTVKALKDQFAIRQFDYDTQVRVLSPMGKELLFSKIATEELKKQNELRSTALKQVDGAAQFLQILGQIPGLGSVASSALERLADKAQESIENNQKAFSSTDAIFDSLSESIGAVTSGFNVTVGLLALFLSQFSKLNNLSTEFQRSTGETIKGFDNFNNRALISGIDRFETLNQVTAQFGFNAQRAFDNFNLEEATELRELMGLTAESAGRFAFFAQVTGDNLKISAANAFAGVDAAFSQRLLFEQIGNISDSIAITFDGNLEAMVGTANAAKRLGLNLTQVDQIASGLLDIESSIAAEFEAEVISGKQINLERARFFALTNNLAGVTEEIAKNQEVINSFASGTRIEQEAIASALNLSRDDISKMIFDQSIINGMTAEEAGLRAGMNIEDAKRLALQDQIAKSVEKISILFAGVSAFILSAVDNVGAFYGILTAITSISLVKLVGGLAQAALAFGSIGFAINPLAIAGVIAGTAILGGVIASQMSKLSQVGDAIIPAGRGPIISTREGGLIQGTANDDIIMAPGVARGRNAGLSSSDINAIAKAVRDGASQAQINLDGGMVSNRLQPSLAVNTRKYSI